MTFSIDGRERSNDVSQWQDRSRIQPPTTNRIEFGGGGLVRLGNSQQRWMGNNVASSDVDQKMSQPLMVGGLPVKGSEERFRFGMSPQRISLETTGFIDARARRSPMDTTPSANPLTDQQWKDQFNPAKSGSDDFRRLWAQNNPAPELNTTGLISGPTIGGHSLEAGNLYADNIAKEMMGVA